MESLRFEPLGQVNLTFDDIQVLPGNGSHQFRIPISLIGSWLDKDGADTAQVLTTGRVWVDRAGPRWVGELGTQVITVRGYAVSHDLLIDVTDDQLVALERGRTDGDLRFQVDLQVTLLNAPEKVYPVKQSQIAFRVTASRWGSFLIRSVARSRSSSASRHHCPNPTSSSSRTTQPSGPRRWYTRLRTSATPEQSCAAISGETASARVGTFWTSSPSCRASRPKTGSIQRRSVVRKTSGWRHVLRNAEHDPRGTPPRGRGRSAVHLEPADR
jgi:hypothetical protein